MFETAQAGENSDWCHQKDKKTAVSKQLCLLAWKVGEKSGKLKDCYQKNCLKSVAGFERFYVKIC